MSTDQNQALAEALRDALVTFGNDSRRAIEKLVPLYDGDLVFRDPLQELRGREAFLAMNRRIVARARRVAYEVHEVVVGSGSIFIAWTMLYERRTGHDLTFEGVSHLHTRDGVVTEHRDHWDLLSSVTKGVPVVGKLYASLTPHLA